MEKKSSEDARKKRHSTEVAEGATGINEEKVKKLRAHQSSGIISRAEHVEKTQSEAQKSEDSKAPEKLPDQSPGDDKSVSRRKKVWDLESALHHVAQARDDDEHESLSSDGTWVRFRVGHAGDVSALAAFYRKSTNVPKQSKTEGKNSTTSSSAEDTSLEVLLADGLGDEDTPPSVFALLADIYKPDNPKVAQLAASALLTLGWQENARVLRVEWLATDKDQEVASILERRLWLRLSTLALMTSCQLLVVNERPSQR